VDRVLRPLRSLERRIIDPCVEFRKNLRHFVIAASVIIGIGIPAGAQWLKYPSTGVPRTAAGKVNMSAPAPRTADGKPDFSGLWLTARPLCFEKTDPDSVLCGLELPIGLDGVNIGASLKGGLPYQPWLAKLVKERSSNNAKDDPHVRCLPDTFLRAYSLPHLLKIVQTPGLLMMLSEVNASYRQVFTDGRPLPAGSHAVVAGILIGDVGRRRAGGRLDRIPRWPVDRLERERNRRGRLKCANASGGPDYGHLDIEVTGGRSEGLHQALDRHAPSADRR
jgi:hypothetical protein